MSSLSVLEVFLVDFLAFGAFSEASPAFGLASASDFLAVFFTVVFFVGFFSSGFDAAAFEVDFFSAAFEVFAFVVLAVVFFS